MKKDNLAFGEDTPTKDQAQSTTAEKSGDTEKGKPKGRPKKEPTPLPDGWLPPHEYPHDDYRFIIKTLKDWVLKDLKKNSTGSQRVVDVAFIFDKQGHLRPQNFYITADGNLGLTKPDCVSYTDHDYLKALIQAAFKCPVEDLKLYKSLLTHAASIWWGCKSDMTDLMVKNEPFGALKGTLLFQNPFNYYKDQGEDLSFDKVCEDVKSRMYNKQVDSADMSVVQHSITGSGFNDDPKAVACFNHIVDTCFKYNHDPEADKHAYLEYLSTMVFQSRKGLSSTVLHLRGAEHTGKSLLTSDVIYPLVGGVCAFQAMDLKSKFLAPEAPIAICSELGQDLGDKGDSQKKIYSDKIKQWAKETAPMPYNKKYGSDGSFVPEFYLMVTSNQSIFVETTDSKMDHVVGIYFPRRPAETSLYEDLMFEYEGEKIDAVAYFKQKENRSAVCVSVLREVLFPIYKERLKRGIRDQRAYQSEGYSEGLQSAATHVGYERWEQVRDYTNYLIYAYAEMDKYNIHPTEIEEICKFEDLNLLGLEVPGEVHLVRGACQRLVTSSDEGLDFLRKGVDNGTDFVIPEPILRHYMGFSPLPKVNTESRHMIEIAFTQLGGAIMAETNLASTLSRGNRFSTRIKAYYYDNDAREYSTKEVKWAKEPTAMKNIYPISKMLVAYVKDLGLKLDSELKEKIDERVEDYKARRAEKAGNVRQLPPQKPVQENIGQLVSKDIKF